MYFKINGLLCTIVLTIELINGQDFIEKQSRHRNEHVKQMFVSAGGRHLAQVKGPKPLMLTNMVQPGSPHSEQQVKYVVVPKQPDSPYATSFIAEWTFGIVPYYIDDEVYDENLKHRIQKAMSIVEASSCVIFREEPEKPLGSDLSWLHFTNPKRQRECSHDTHKGADNDIIIVLGIECLKTRDVLHSVLHGLGFKDEVSHPHRDQYIRILWENVQPRYRPLFRSRLDKAPYKLVEYDPMSIMHFHDRAYSENGGLTIAPVMPGLAINPSDTLSQLDVMKLRLMFGHECNKRKVGDLVESCKNVLYNKNSNPEIKTLNSEDTDDEHKSAEKDDENQQSTIEELSNKKQLEEDGDDEKQLNAEESNENKQLKAVTDGGDYQQLADPDIEHLPLKANEDGTRNSMDLRSAKDEIVEGVREGRRDYPLHLWKYNTDRLH